MRILVLNEYFPPDTAATANMAAAVVGALKERHKVTVLCGRPSYDPSERHPYYLWRREHHTGTVAGRKDAHATTEVAVERVGSTAFSRRRMLHRLSNYLSYVLLSVPRALMIPTDMVLAMTDPPFQGIVGAFVAWLKRRTFVYNIRDLYPEMAITGQIVRPARWVRIWERLHRWALARAARVIVLGEDTRERIIAKGIESSRVVVVRDGVHMPSPVPPPDHPVLKDIRAGCPFVVLHAGNLGFYGAWQTVVTAARSLNGDGIGFVFIGDGAMRSQIQASAEGCKAIRFLPFRPADEVPYVLAAPDLHLVTIRRGLEGVVVPSKLYPILAAARPVLALAPEESDVARIIRRSGCGIVADPDDPQSLARIVLELAHDPQRLARMSERAAAVAPEFSRASELRRFVDILEAAV
jgi:glycosyltransferase involved in cell wall biosynthesis